MQPPKIDNSTKEERQAYVLDTWKCLHDCEACGKCRILKGRDAETLYADYIEGKRNYMDITLEIRNRNYWLYLLFISTISVITFRCKSWKILSINWLNIARTNIEPKNSVQLTENGITHYYIAYCILYLHLFHQNSFFLFFFNFFAFCAFLTLIHSKYTVF